jgi:hypothetical protein
VSGDSVLKSYLLATIGLIPAIPNLLEQVAVGFSTPTYFHRPLRCAVEFLVT